MSDEFEIEADAPLFDATDRPPAGTECARCRKLFAHYCPAKGYVGEWPLCVACGEGGQCEQTEARLRLERSGGYDDMEADAHGLHGECRQIAITDAERIVAPEVAASSAWSIKAQLDPANLIRMKRVRPEAVHVRGKRSRRLEAERDAGRRRKMAETRVVRETTAREVAPTVAAALCKRGCGRPVHRGMCAKALGAVASTQVEPAKPKTAKKAAKKAAALAKLEAALPPLPGVLEVSGFELITVKVSEAALTRLFAMLPPQMKGAAIEKLLAEMAAA